MRSAGHMKNGVRAVLYTLIVSTTMAFTLSNNGWAMLAPAAAPAEGPAYNRAADMKSVQTALESKIVRERLKSFGLTDEEVATRLGKLSDRQLHKLSKDIKALRPGGGVTGLLELVVLVLLIILLVRVL